MLCTAISDAYRTDERADVYEALTRVLGPGQADWTTKGVYAYWDFDSHELLYVGLANDLPGRFAQHNGITRHAGGNKTVEIAGYFATRERLGFTVLIQSKAVQILEDINAIDPTLGAVARNIIEVGEGQLIEMHRLVHGRWPAWNKTGGAKAGQRWATAARGLLDVLSLSRDSLFTARRPLRVVAEDLRIRFYESTVHASRMRAVMGAHFVGRMPTGEEEIQELVMKSLMLREGHLVQDLDTTDDEIRRWVALLGTPEQWEKDAREHRARFFEAVGEGPLPQREQQMVELLDATISEAAPTAHIDATADILRSGYLDRPLLLDEG